MNITVVGTGYVGLVAGVCFADSGHNVVCVDRDKNKIESLIQGRIPIFEPGLEDLLKTAHKRITFSTDLPSALTESDVIFVAVGTPELADGSADTGPTIDAIREICMSATGPKFLVMKSTVPVGTARKIIGLVKEMSRFPIEIISNPEFLREGSAVDDFLRPDRVIVGVRNGDEASKAANLMRELYEPFLDQGGKPLLIMDHTAAEMTKYAANAFLSVKISFINELALLADKVGCDIEDVRRGFTSDRRINPAFFQPGVGYGGSCFPKDVKALVYTGKTYGLPMHVVSAADQVNVKQKLVLFEKMQAFYQTLQGRTIAVWGLAFKPYTDDVREAPALELIAHLAEAGVKIRAYDPIAGKSALLFSRTEFQLCESPEEAVRGADGLAILTEWNEFRSPNLVDMKASMRTAAIFDGRNVLDPRRVREAGFEYFCIGRECLKQP